MPRNDAGFAGGSDERPDDERPDDERPDDEPPDDERPDDERPDDQPGLESGASIVPPPRDAGSKSARAEQAKSVGGATGELAEDDGLLQTDQVDRGGVDRLAEAMRSDEEDERRADDLDRQSWTAELSPDDLEDDEQPSS